MPSGKSDKRHSRTSTVAVIAASVVLALLTLACEQPVGSEDRIGVAATILPQAEFVERVGGDLVDVTVMVPPGASPHTYEPTPSQMAKVASARVYAKVGSGVEFELAWLDRILEQNRDMLVVDCSQGVDLIEMGHRQETGPGEHDHGAADPHIWMSPLNARVMVENICRGLSEVDPDNRSFYETNRDSYLEELTELDQDIRSALANVTGAEFMAYHPGLGYFADEYGLTMLSIEEEGKEPTAAALASLIDRAKAHNIGAVFASPQFNLQSAKTIAAEIGAEVILVDTLAREYVANLRHILEEVVRALE